MRKAKNPEKAKKHKKRFRVVMEIAFLVLGILCSTMPQPFPLLVPIGIGTIRIISSAVQRERTEAAPPPVVYCNGEKEPHKTTNEKRTTTTPKKSAAGSKAKGK